MLISTFVRDNFPSILIENFSDLLNTTKHFESLSDEEKNKIMFVIHGCLFEDGQAQEQIFFEDASDESRTAEKANWILKDWMGVEVELGPKSISKLLKLNGEMF